MVCPVTCRDRSDARNNNTDAMSEGNATWPNGVTSSRGLRRSGPSSVATRPVHTGPGADRVDADAVGPELLGRRLHQLHQPGLHRAVRGVQRRRGEPRRRPDEHHCSAARGDQSPPRELRGHERVAQHELMGLVPGGVVHFQQRRERGNAHDVDEYVEPSVEDAVDGGEEAFHVASIGDVGH